MIKRYNIIRQY